MNQFLFLIELGSGETILGTLRARSGADARIALDEWARKEELTGIVRQEIVGVTSRTFQAERFPPRAREPR